MTWGDRILRSEHDELAERFSRSHVDSDALVVIDGPAVGRTSSDPSKRSDVVVNRSSQSISPRSSEVPWRRQVQRDTLPPRAGRNRLAGLEGCGYVAARLPAVAEPDRLR